MVAGFQAREETSLGESLEVIFTNILKISGVSFIISTTRRSHIHQHCCTKVKLVKELGDKNVHFQNICNVLLLYFSQNIDEPFKLPVGLSDPQEVDFLTSNSRIS